MLAEAVDVIRQLWTGDTVDHWGEYYTVENARLVRTFEDAGFDHIHFHQVGPDQRGFADFWRNELVDALQ